MNTKRVDKWVWILIYLGMAVLAIGIASRDADPAVGWVLGGVGAGSIVVGAVLIWLRSRVQTDTP